MVYRLINGTNKYQVFTDDKKPAGSFSYHVESSPADICRFMIDGIDLNDAYYSYDTLEAVLLFIQYKCERTGCPTMYIKLDQKNLLYKEMYRRFGFYMIDLEEIRLPHGQISEICVLKYVLPTSHEEILREYIFRQQTGNHRYF